MDYERIATALAIAFLLAAIDGFWRRWKFISAARAELARRDRLSAERDSIDR